MNLIIKFSQFQIGNFVQLRIPFRHIEICIDPFYFMSERFKYVS
nr:MAG TPA: hypothetical protein [Crassvirales sp.]